MAECESHVSYEKCLKEIPPIVTKESAKNNAEQEARINLLNDHVELVVSLRQNKHIWRVPWFIVIMCLIQISMYFIANQHVRLQLMFMPERTEEYWRYFTYMLLHSDILHLTMNICLQCIIGFCLESEQSHAKVAMIYVIGGISGSVATLYLQPQLSLMGASAGVYALLISHIPHTLKNFYNLPHRYLRIAAIVILLLSDVCFTTFHVLINHNTNPRICLEAHAAGAMTGLVLGSLIYSATKVQKTSNVWLASIS